MTEDSEIKGDKRLSKESKNLIRELQKIATKASAIIPRLYESLRKDGLEPFQARGYIQELVDVSQRTVRGLLSEEARHTEMTRLPHTTAEKISANPEPEPKKEIQIPPPKQEIKEVEPEPITENKNNSRKLNTSKFRSQLRIALMNGDTIEVLFNDFEVIGIR